MEENFFDLLCEPFPLELVDWRVGSTNREKTRGMALAYIDARTVMDRLDMVCGPENWQCNYSAGMAGSIVCNLGVLCKGQWVWKADGAGATGFEAEKGALSDAFKRAAVRWGVGRYLYDMPSPWVVLTEGRIAGDARRELDDNYVKHAGRSQWGGPAATKTYRMLLTVVQTFVKTAAHAVEFREAHSGLLAQLPVAQRRHLESELKRIEEANGKEKPKARANAGDTAEQSPG